MEGHEALVTQGQNTLKVPFKKTGAPNEMRKSLSSLKQLNEETIQKHFRNSSRSGNRQSFLNRDIPELTGDNSPRENSKSVSQALQTERQDVIEFNSPIQDAEDSFAQSDHAAPQVYESPFNQKNLSKRYSNLKTGNFIDSSILMLTQEIKENDQSPQKYSPFKPNQSNVTLRHSSNTLNSKHTPNYGVGTKLPKNQIEIFKNRQTIFSKVNQQANLLQLKNSLGPYQQGQYNFKLRSMARNGSLPNLPSANLNPSQASGSAYPLNPQITLSAAKTMRLQAQIQKWREVKVHKMNENTESQLRRINNLNSMTSAHSLHQYTSNLSTLDPVSYMQNQPNQLHVGDQNVYNNLNLQGSLTSQQSKRENIYGFSEKSQGFQMMTTERNVSPTMGQNVENLDHKQVMNIAIKMRDKKLQSSQSQRTLFSAQSNQLRQKGNSFKTKHQSYTQSNFPKQTTLSTKILNMKEGGTIQMNDQRKKSVIVDAKTLYSYKPQHHHQKILMSALYTQSKINFKLNVKLEIQIQQKAQSQICIQDQEQQLRSNQVVRDPQLMQENYDSKSVVDQQQQVDQDALVDAYMKNLVQRTKIFYQQALDSTVTSGSQRVGSSSSSGRRTGLQGSLVTTAIPSPQRKQSLPKNMLNKGIKSKSTQGNLGKILQQASLKILEQEFEKLQDNLSFKQLKHIERKKKRQEQVFRMDVDRFLFMQQLMKQEGQNNICGSEDKELNFTSRNKNKIAGARTSLENQKRSSTPSLKQESSNQSPQQQMKRNVIKVSVSSRNTSQINNSFQQQNMNYSHSFKRSIAERQKEEAQDLSRNEERLKFSNQDSKGDQIVKEQNSTTQDEEKMQMYVNQIDGSIDFKEMIDLQNQMMNSSEDQYKDLTPFQNNAQVIFSQTQSKRLSPEKQHLKIEQPNFQKQQDYKHLNTSNKASRLENLILSEAKSRAFAQMSSQQKQRQIYHNRRDKEFDRDMDMLLVQSHHILESALLPPTLPFSFHHRRSISQEYSEEGEATGKHFNIQERNSQKKSREVGQRSSLERQGSPDYKYKPRNLQTSQSNGGHPTSSFASPHFGSKQQKKNQINEDLQSVYVQPQLRENRNEGKVYQFSTVSNQNKGELQNNHEINQTGYGTAQNNKVTDINGRVQQQVQTQFESLSQPDRDSLLQTEDCFNSPLQDHKMDAVERHECETNNDHNQQAMDNNIIGKSQKFISRGSKVDQGNNAEIHIQPAGYFQENKIFNLKLNRPSSLSYQQRVAMKTHSPFRLDRNYQRKHNRLQENGSQMSQSIESIQNQVKLSEKSLKKQDQIERGIQIDGNEEDLISQGNYADTSAKDKPIIHSRANKQLRLIQQNDSQNLFYSSAQIKRSDANEERQQSLQQKIKFLKTHEKLNDIFYEGDSLALKNDEYMNMLAEFKVKNFQKIKDLEEHNDLNQYLLLAYNFCLLKKRSKPTLKDGDFLKFQKAAVEEFNSRSINVSQLSFIDKSGIEGKSRQINKDSTDDLKEDIKKGALRFTERDISSISQSDKQGSKKSPGKSKRITNESTKANTVKNRSPQKYTSKAIYPLDEIPILKW